MKKNIALKGSAMLQKALASDKFAMPEPEEAEKCTNNYRHIKLGKKQEHTKEALK